MIFLFYHKRSYEISSEENQLLFDFRNLNDKNKKDLLWYLDALKTK